jgi:hypothetical protein
MAEGYDYNKEHLVCHGVDDSVFPDPDSVTRSSAQRPGRRRPRILSQERDHALNPRPSL